MLTKYYLKRRIFNMLVSDYLNILFEMRLIMRFRLILSAVYSFGHFRKVRLLTARGER